MFRILRHINTPADEVPKPSLKEDARDATLLFYLCFMCWSAWQVYHWSTGGNIPTSTQRVWAIGVAALWIRSTIYEVGARVRDEQK